MTNKSLKIRIKLHTGQDLLANEPPILDKINEGTPSTKQHSGKHKLLSKMIFTFGGLFFLSASALYLGLSNQDLASNQANIDEQSTTLSKSYQLKPSINSSVSAFPPGAPSMNDLSSLSEPARSGLKEEETDDEPMLPNIQGNEDQLSETDILADESFPVNEPMIQQDLADIPSIDRIDDAVSPTLYGMKVSSNPPAGIPETEPGDTEDSAARPETLVSAVSVNSLYPPNSPNIARAQLTNDVINREPIDRIEEVVRVEGQSLRRLFYYTEFRNMQGQKAVHIWEHDGKVVAEVKFHIRGDRWRVYSSKYLSPSMTGDWIIHVIDGEGKPLKSENFVYSSYE